MNRADFDYRILQLTQKFYADYPPEVYREILQKKKRAYACLLLKTKYDYYICLPYRTEIRHNQAYFFKDSKRSEKHRSGLDYSKMLIVKNPKYLGAEDTIIDQDEFKETRRNIHKIARQANAYLETYIKHRTKIALLAPKQYERQYKFSTLKYFHQELGLETSIAPCPRPDKALS